MPEYLETTADKFTFKVARDRLYTQDGVWILPVESPEGVKVRVGLTDYLQQHSGDAAFANLKPIGTPLNVGDEFAEIETIKVNVSLPSPVAGAIVQVNKALEMCPELVNQDPYDKGWLVLVKPTDWDTTSAGLLDPNAYFDLMRSQVDEELKETS
ncbi:MAG: glycine cleavage system protein H [Candidatus Korobacteraceae bacterium]